jgi:hypothetical protein
LYENHAVNANTIFDPNAQDIYRNSGYRTPNIARSIANSAQLQGESAQKKVPGDNNNTIAKAHFIVTK